MSNTEDSATGNARKGFASNPENINRAGRPKGSRNRSTLIKAQIKMDSATEYAAELLEAIMSNDKEFLGIKDDVPVGMRIAAAKEVLNKSIANEKDKEPVVETPKSQDEEEAVPMFSPVPVTAAGS